MPDNEETIAKIANLDDDPPIKLALMLARIGKYDPDHLTERPGVWGTFHFSKFRTSIQSLFSITEDLLGLPLDNLPTSAASEMCNIFQGVGECLEEIDKFNPESMNNPGQHRDQLGSRLSDLVDGLIRYCASWLAYLPIREGM